MAQPRTLEQVVQQLEQALGQQQTLITALQNGQAQAQANAQQAQADLQQAQADTQAARQEAQQARTAAQQAQQAAAAAGQAGAQPAPAQGARTRVKIMTFSNAADEDWLVWKFHFDKARILNGYNDGEAKLALSAAMKGRAAASVMDIEVQNAFEDINTLIEHYDRRFLPASASQMARVSFDQVVQKQGETILDYHSKVRQLWNRAYPNNPDEVLLIRKFSLGLRKKEVREQVVRQNPQTYGAALEAAQNEASVMRVVSVTETGAAVEPMEIGMVGAIRRTKVAGNPKKNTGARPKAISALRTRGANQKSEAPGTKGNCHFCQKPGHYKSNCFLFQKAKKLMSGGKGGSSGQGQRSSQWKRNPRNTQRRTGQFSSASISMMEALLEEPEADGLVDEALESALEQLEELVDEGQEDLEDVEEDEEADDADECFQ